MRERGVGWLIILVLCVFGVAGAATAQTQLGGFNVEGEVEAGGRFYIERPPAKDRAKFEEYRDLTPGPVLFGLNLRLLRPDESLYAEFGGSKWGYSDQDYYLSVGKLGGWQFDFLWDQTPHVISTNARFLATEPQRGMFVLPSPRPTLDAYNNARTLDEISVRWDKAAMRFNYSVSPNLDLTAEYTRIHKEGDKPMGMAFGSPGNNFYEVLQPIEQTVHDFRIRGAFSDPRYQLQFQYGLSVFENDLSRIRADNPCFGNVAPCSGSDAGGPGTGQSSLPPDNMAHSLSAAAGVNLPLRTRVNGNAAWGLQLQNDAFLPHTINPVLAASGPDVALPKHSLEGMVQTWLVYLSATSRPFDPVTFGARYRFYDYSDNSRTITFPGVVLDDDALEPARRAVRFSYQKQNADLDARTRLLDNTLALTTGVGWERWDRSESREVPISDEYVIKAALDATPTEWLLARLTYTPSFRRISEYNTFAHAEHSVLEDPGAAQAGQSVLLRKFDESNRNRQRVDAQLQLSLGEAFTVTPTASYHWDDYYDSPLGLQQETGWSAGLDLTWRPQERVSFSAGYMYEHLVQKMESRSRPVNGTVTLDVPDFDWTSDIQDTVHTVYAGLKAALLPRVLDLRVDLNYSTSLGRVDTRNPIPPTSGSAAQNNSATAQRFPAFEDSLVHLEAALIYHFLKNWSAKVGYMFEMFDNNDWRTNTLDPFVAGVSSIWLGNDLRNYTAHLMGASVAYRFK